MIAPTLIHTIRPLARFVAARIRGHKFPLAVTLCITNRCNLRCTYCHMPTTEREEMPTPDWLRAIDEFRHAGMIRASLMGGEPLLRPDCGEIIAHLKHRGVHAAMNTNGWFVEDRIDEVARLDLVCVGLDGPQEIHNAQRRHPKSFERALRAIELLRTRRVAVVTMTPVTARGIDHVDFVLSLAREMDFRAGFQLEHDANCDVRLPIGPRLEDDRINAFARHLLARKQEGWPVAASRAFLETLMTRGRRMLTSCRDCRVPRHSLMVRPDGMIVPCFLTQHQGPMVSGRERGFARAFFETAQPSDPGCSSQPLMEMHLAFGLHPGAVLHAMGMM